MLDSLRLRVGELKLFSSFWETILFSTLFVSLLFFLSGDIIALDSYHDIVLLFLALITLYNGTLHGIVALTIIASGIYFYTITYDPQTILAYLVFILLFGEFHFHFKRTGEKDREEKQYLKTKFRELSNAFYALKVSHDQLEKGYLIKPVTLRSMILKLSEELKHKDVYERLFTSFTEAFSIKTARFCRLDHQEHIVEEIPLGESTFSCDTTHTMIEQAMLEKRAVFLADEKLELLQNEPILAVIPILDTQEHLLGLFIIEKMDFLEFNMDNILKIQILLEYLTQERFYHAHRHYTSTHLNLKNLDAKFQFEVDRLFSMYQRFDVHSAIVMVYTKDPAISLAMENFTTKKMRLLDMVTLYKKENTYFYLFLLPLERLSGAISFKSRIEETLAGFESQKYEILITEIKKVDTLEHWINEYEA
jgi:hypothetical protein